MPDEPPTRIDAPAPQPPDGPASTVVRSAEPAAAGTATLVSHSSFPAGPSTGLPAVAGYEVTGEIARGGMGRVLAARDTTLDRQVAIKVLLPGGDSADAARRFVTESKVTAQLPHPNIPPVYALGSLADGSPFLAMKLVEGRTLSALLRDRAGPGDDLPRFVQVFEQICHAVGFAHARNVIHRDLKPANVMIGAFGEVQVMDWGLARVGTDDDGRAADRPTASDAATTSFLPERSSASTQAGQVMGTPAYMAPEQARGEPVDCRADVFALGGILCEMLTDSRPFTGASSTEVILQAAAGDVAGAHARLDACALDAELVTLAKHCLAPAAADRPANGKAAADAVAAYRAGVDERLRTAERRRAAAEAKAVEQRKRRRVQLALAAAVVLIVFGAGAFGWWHDRQTAERRAEADRAQRERQAAELRQQAKDNEIAAGNRQALVEEVGRCEAALRADDAATAGAALAEIDRRANLPGGGEFARRIAGCRADHAMLLRLDRAETARWTLVNGKFPYAHDIHPLWVAAFKEYGIVPGRTPPDEIVRRLDAALIRDRLLMTLDLMNVAVHTTGLVEILHAADPDPVRDPIRMAVQRGDMPRTQQLVEELVRGPALRALPPRFAIALGGATDALVSPSLRRQVLAAAWVRTPDNLGVLMALGKTYRLNVRDSAAERVRWYQSAATLRPNTVSPWLHLGIALYENGQPDEALVAAEECLRLDPRSVGALITQGMALRAKGDTNGALAVYRHVLEIQPDCADPEFHNNFGSALADSGDLDGAIVRFNMAIRIKPDLAAAHGNLGIALLKRGDPDAALASLGEAVALDPGFVGAHARIVEALLAKRDPKGAIAALREAIRHNPREAAFRARLGNLLWDAGDGPGAVAAFQDAIRLEPDAPGHHNNLGILLKLKGDLRGAIAEYREVIRLDPKSTRARFNLGIALWANKDAKGAIVAYRELLAIDPDHINARLNLGYVLDQTEELDAAIAEYREVLRRAPGHTRAKANLEGVLKYKAERDAKEGRIAPPPREVRRP